MSLSWPLSICCPLDKLCSLIWHSKVKTTGSLWATKDSFCTYLTLSVMTYTSTVKDTCHISAKQRNYTQLPVWVWHTFFGIFVHHVLTYLILSQWRVMFISKAGFDERRQSLSSPLSHPGVRVLANLQDMSHVRKKRIQLQLATDLMFRRTIPSSGRSGWVWNKWVNETTECVRDWDFL